MRRKRLPTNNEGGAKTIAKLTYYGDRISPNMTVTPNGFLVCHNVPIARTGAYEYLGREIGLDSDDIVKVFRPPEEVFNPAAMASFEGVPLTYNHPPEEVNAGNATVYSRGVVQNIRRGNGEDADKLIADLVVHDKSLIDQIMNGTREVSCGYMCDYSDNGDGTYAQGSICGNHVAVVENGRAGDKIAIRDAEPESKRIARPDQNPDGTAYETKKEDHKQMEKKIKLARSPAFPRDGRIGCTRSKAIRHGRRPGRNHERG
ncbi:DUF2213 domain-containing protein [Paenibacillus sp. P26]|nr:DUF2213 domain-containing protein [Paenibacillus sp. P26]